MHSTAMAHCRKNRAGRLEKNEWLLLLLTVATAKGAAERRRPKKSH